MVVSQCSLISTPQHLEKQARKPRSYASPKLRLTDSPTHWLTGVKCRATSVAKNVTEQQQQQEEEQQPEEEYRFLGVRFSIATSFFPSEVLKLFRFHSFQFLPHEKGTMRQQNRQDYRTRGQQDNKTTGQQWDNKIAGQQNNGTTRQQNKGTTRQQRDKGTTEKRDKGKTGQQENGTTPNQRDKLQVSWVAPLGCSPNVFVFVFF